MLADTENKPDELILTKERVAACLFDNDIYTTDGNVTSLLWERHRLHIEFKLRKRLDAFCDNESQSFEQDTQHGRKTRRQIISYAALVFKYQHRAFFFTLLVLGSEARIIRWDRAGAIVTDRFDYVESPEVLQDFFWRFSQLSDEERGIDMTVQPATDDERAIMEEAASDDNKLRCRDYARVDFGKSLQKSRQWWKICVLSTSEAQRYFLVGTPRFYDGGMVGRGTRGYVALDVTLGQEKNNPAKFVWLKDAWRVDHPDIHQEGEILNDLNQKGVKYIPTLHCHGDVPKQSTITHTYWGGDGRNPLRRHTHYRLVVFEVGRLLKEFENGQQLLGIFLHCLRGASCSRTYASGPDDSVQLISKRGKRAKFCIEM